MRLIDADELKKYSYRTDWNVPVVDVNDIDKAPTIEERPHGEWIRTALYGMTCYECNRCHLHYDLRSFFCPNCGADMRGDIK